jgi:hypothetical protein
MGARRSPEALLARLRVVGLSKSLEARGGSNAPTPLIRAGGNDVLRL